MAGGQPACVCQQQQQLSGAAYAGLWMSQMRNAAVVGYMSLMLSRTAALAVVRRIE